MKDKMFKKDFAYKFIKPTSFINYHEAPKMVIPLWRTNRLSIVRGYLFLQNFFQEITLKKLSIITIKYKRADKQTKKKPVFFFHVLLNDTHLFIFLLYYFPEPLILSSKNGYILVFPFYQFLIKVPCDIKHYSMFVYRIAPYIPELISESTKEKKPNN